MDVFLGFPEINPRTDTTLLVAFRLLLRKVALRVTMFWWRTTTDAGKKMLCSDKLRGNIFSTGNSIPR
jgi:hypothetical protein